MKADRIKNKILNAKPHNYQTILDDDTPFAITEAYKAVRSNITFALADKKGSKSIIITGAGRSEGKSTSCVNLAITFAELGEKVIILDCDLRRPNIHKKFSMKNTKGVSDLLAGLCTPKEAIRHSEKYGLDFISAGKTPPNPAELLSMPSMDELINALSQNYDYIFLDTPPVNLVTDATVLSKKADGVIFVVRENFATKEEVDEAVKALKFAGARMLGFLMNDVELKAMKHRRYKYDYQYGYGVQPKQTDNTNTK